MITTTADRSTDRIDRFDLLWDESFRRVLGYALRRADPEEARDVASETFLVAWRRLDQVPIGDDALPWLLATARHLLANRRRASAVRTRAASDLAQPSLVGDPADRVADRDTLVRAFGRLGERDREVLALLAWDGLRAHEAAVVLGCSSGAFAVRAHRARRRLAAALDARPGLDPEEGSR